VNSSAGPYGGRNDPRSARLPLSAEATLEDNAVNGRSSRHTRCPLLAQRWGNRPAACG